MWTDTPKQLESWIFQQRDAYERFFVIPRRSGSPHLCDLLPPGVSDLEYLGCAGRRDAYLWETHHRQSRVAELIFSVAGEICTLLVPAPRDDGVFVVDGTAYTAPFQRLWDTGRKEVAEYRRIDHVLLDARMRRRAGVDAERLPKPCRPTTAQAAFAALARFLRCVLKPCNNPERLFLPLQTDLNRWGELAAQSQVRTLVVKWTAGIKDTPCPRGGRPYRIVQESEMLGTGAREPDAGLDAFHTPEGKQIGLTRHLTLGTTVTDDRSLQVEATEAVGLMASMVPFAQHDDARRVLMACTMTGRAIRTEGACSPRCQTGMERMLRSLPKIHAGDYGVDLRVGFMFREGLNFEDAVVVSESAAAKLSAVERRVVSVPVPCFCKPEPRGVGPVAKGEALAVFRYQPLQLGFRMAAPTKAAMGGGAGSVPADLELPVSGARCPCDGIIEKVDATELWKEDCPGAFRCSHRVDFTIRIDRPLRIGDKICNRHGNKGVVSSVVPDADMPVADGLPLEVLFNPVGVVNRGNHGQLLEVLAGQLGELSPGIVPDPESRLRALSAQPQASVPQCSTVTVPSPNGPSEVQALVGTNHVLRLPHHAADEFNVCGGGLFSAITGQPPKGVGQKYGEMEIAALQAHGANAILKELCVVRSRETAKGSLAPGVQRSLVEWLRSVGFLLKQDGSDELVRLLDRGRFKPPGKNLVSAAVKCAADPDCNARDGGNGNAAERIPLKTLYRRLCSEPFFDECGGIFLDLGRTLDLAVRPRLGDTPLRFSIRYLAIPHPRFRPSAPTSPNKTTKLTMRVVAALWNQSNVRNASRNGSEGRDDGVRQACETLLGHLVHLLSGKNGIVRRVGLSRRITHSARCVIVPAPLLPVDCVSVPWDAVRILYGSLLGTSEWARGLVCTTQEQVNPLFHDVYKERIDGLLRDEWVLLNRAPSLHKYNVMAFRPRVHFDSWAMRLPPAATGPFAADHDGDQMSVIPLFDEAAKREAVGLSIPRNLVSAADDSAIPSLTKDFRLGLHLCWSNRLTRTALDDALSAAGHPALPDVDDATGAYGRWVREWPASGDGFPEALGTLMAHSLRALASHPKQSCFGEFEAMRGFFEAFRESGAAKTEKLWDKHGSPANDAPLLAGIRPAALREQAVERISCMVIGKLSIGDFGGLQRRLYYRIRGNCSGTLAFNWGMRDALVSLQSLTERATQCALSVKGSVGVFGFNEFEAAMEDMIANRRMPPQHIQEHLGFSADCLRRHMDVLADQLFTAKDCIPMFLSFLTSPFEKSPCEECTGDTTDPRIAVFLA